MRFALFLSENVDAGHARLQAAGVCVLAWPTDRPWGERTLHVADTDGSVVELTRRSDPCDGSDRSDELKVV